MSTQQQQDEARGVFIVGATGAVGSKLASLLSDRGHRVSGLHRSDDDRDAVEQAGAIPVRGDLVDDAVDDLAGRIQGHDAVVFVAGAGGDADAVDAVDRDGARKAADAAERAGVSRFVLLSVFMDAWRGDESPGEGFEHYMQAKRAADVHLAASGLDWLIVRPGTLTDDDGTGQVTANSAVAYEEIPRADVAAVLAQALFDPELNRVDIEVTKGTTPIADALAGLRARAWQAA